MTDGISIPFSLFIRARAQLPSNAEVWEAGCGLMRTREDGLAKEKVRELWKME